MKAGWEVKALGEVCTKIGSGATPRGGNDSYKEEGISLIRSLNVHDLEFRPKDLALIDDTQAEALSNVEVSAGDVLLNITGASVARCCIAPTDLLPARVNQHVSILRPKPEVLSTEFLAYLLVSKEMKDKLLGIGDEGGSTRQALTKAQLQAFPIPLPPLDEQKRIVAVLDAAFEGLTRARAHTETNLQNARELFEELRETTLYSNQHQWDLTPLGNLIDIKHGYAFKSEFFAEVGEYVLLTPGNYFETGGYRDRGEKQKFYGGEIPRDFLLAKGDLLMAMTEQAPGLLGSCIIVPDDQRFLHNQRIGLISPKVGVGFCNNYFAHAFNLAGFRRSLSDTCSGATVRHTSPSRIQAVSIPFVVNADEQRRIADFLTDSENQTCRLQSHYRAKLADLDALRQSLLQKAFAGELT